MAYTVGWFNKRKVHSDDTKAPLPKRGRFHDRVIRKMKSLAVAGRSVDLNWSYSHWPDH